MPRVDTNGSNAVHMAMQEIFRAPYADQSIFEEAATQICTWVCPQRGYFRFAADIIVVLVAVLILRFAFSCNTRHSFEQNKKYVIGVLLIVAILILLIAALLYCDPYYQKIREGNLPLFVLILMVFVVSIWLYRRHAKRSQNP